MSTAQAGLRGGTSIPCRAGCADRKPVNESGEEALIDHLALRGATLAGHSMGTGEVTRYMTRHDGEGKVSKVALLAAITPCAKWHEDNPDGAPEAAYEAVAAQIVGDWARYWNSWPGALFGTHLGNPISAETIDWAGRDAMETPMMVVLRTWHSIFHTDFRADLRQFAFLH